MFGNSDVIGRVQGDHSYSHELTFTPGNPICQIWLIHEEGRVKEVGFETEYSKDLRREGSHQITDSTVCRQTSFCIKHTYTNFSSRRLHGGVQMSEISFVFFKKD